MPKSKSSRLWLREHRNDTYVQRAKKEGYRARSVYKLLEINDRHKLFKPGMVVIDLGAAPGSWSKLALEKIGKKGMLLALDILPIEPIPGVIFLQGDFTKNIIIEELMKKLDGKLVDVVLSDMAPNLSGCEITDQSKTMELALAALIFARKVLAPHGIFLVKVFQGEEFPNYLKKIREYFMEIKTIKPEASRARSKEVFLLAKTLKSL